MISRRKFCQSSALAAVSSVALGEAAQRPASQGSAPASKGKEVLHKDAQLQRFRFWQNQDWDWYRKNIPFFESPDTRLDEVYYYRWEVVRRHLRYVHPDYGHVFTEFVSDQSKSTMNRYGAISAAADLHLDEVRWLKDTLPARQYLRNFLIAPGEKPRAYGFAPTWVGEQLTRVHGGRNPLEDLLDRCVDNYAGWERGVVAYPEDNGFDPAFGLFWNTGRDVGGEYNLASTQLNEELRGIVGYKIRGGAGYRSDVNGILFAEATAIANLADRKGDAKTAATFRQKAALLKQNVQDKLWDPQREFFLHRWRYDEYADGDTPGDRSIKAGSFIWETNRLKQGVGWQPKLSGEGKGREIFSYSLWRYGLPDDNDDKDESSAKGYARSWRFLQSPQHFAGRYGITTAERDDPWFSVVYGECRHNGQTWPFHTSRVLAAGLVLLRDYKHHGSFDRDQWWAIFRTYAALHRNGNDVCIAESADPDRPQWTELRPSGFHYFHSSFADLVICGVAGLRPRNDDVLEVQPMAPAEWDYFALDDVLYRGRRVSIVWDKRGTRYGLGAGLHLLVDGNRLAHADKLGPLSGTMPPIDAAALQRALERLPDECDYAVNAEATEFPKASASFSAPDENPTYPLIGSCWFDDAPIRRWSTRGSRAKTEWFEVQLEQPQLLHRVDVALIEDVYGAAAPQRMHVEVMEAGTWRPVTLTEPLPSPLRARCITRMEFAPRTAARIRVVFEPKPGYGCGLAQLQAWGKPQAQSPRNTTA